MQNWVWVELYPQFICIWVLQCLVTRVWQGKYLSEGNKQKKFFFKLKFLNQKVGTKIQSAHLFDFNIPHMEFSTYTPIAYLYRQNWSLELEWIRTTWENEYWTSRLNRKYLTVKTRMSPVWELNCFMLQQMRPHQFLREIWCWPHLRDIMWCQADWIKSCGVAEMFLNNFLWKQTLSQLILVIANYQWIRWGTAKKCFSEKLRNFHIHNEKDALKIGNKHHVKF